MKKKCFLSLVGIVALTAVVCMGCGNKNQNTPVDEIVVSKEANSNESPENNQEDTQSMPDEIDVTNPDGDNNQVTTGDPIDTDAEEVVVEIRVHENLGDGTIRCSIATPITFSSMIINEAQIGDTITSEQGTEFKVVAAQIPDDMMTEDEFFAKYDKYARITIEGYESLYRRSSAMYEPRYWYMDYPNTEPFEEVILPLSEDAVVDMSAMVLGGEPAVFTGKQFIESGDNFKSEIAGVQFVGGYVNGKAVIKNGVITKITAKWQG